jgi:hypothetical protein
MPRRRSQLAQTTDHCSPRDAQRVGYLLLKHAFYMGEPRHVANARWQMLEQVSQLAAREQFSRLLGNEVARCSGPRVRKRRFRSSFKQQQLVAIRNSQGRDSAAVGLRPVWRSTRTNTSCLASSAAAELPSRRLQRRWHCHIWCAERSSHPRTGPLLARYPCRAHPAR